MSQSEDNSTEQSSSSSFVTQVRERLERIRSRESSTSSPNEEATILATGETPLPFSLGFAELI